jgi:hypothetical protein
VQKLDRKQLSRKAEVVSGVESALSELEDVIATYNQEREDAWHDIEEFIAKDEGLADDIIAAGNDILDSRWKEIEEHVNVVNIRLEALREFRDEIVSAMETYYEGRTEKWQEGEKGSAYTDWMSAWADCGLDDIELPAPVPLDETKDKYEAGVLDDNPGAGLEFADLPDAPE